MLTRKLAALVAPVLLVLGLAVVPVATAPPAHAALITCQGGLSPNYPYGVTITAPTITRFGLMGKAWCTSPGSTHDFYSICIWMLNPNGNGWITQRCDTNDDPFGGYLETFSPLVCGGTHIYETVIYEELIPPQQTNTIGSAWTEAGC